jgi:ATP-binding cassette subfamily F protein 3
MIQFQNIALAYGKNTLFKEVTFALNPGEKIGLVGRNGHGKTTLFKLLLGQEKPDTGQILISQGYRLGYLGQHLAFSHASVLDEALSPLEKLQRHSEGWRSKKVLLGLGIPEAWWNRRPEELSSGYQVRLQMTKLFVSEPDCLLLDEPTNYLDFGAAAWLKEFLNQWPREFLLITHDRRFMDHVTTHIVGLHRQTAKKIQGPTEVYYSSIAQAEAVQEKTRRNEEKKCQAAEVFISRFRAKARLAGLVQSRIKALAKQSISSVLERIEELDFHFTHLPFPGAMMLELQDCSFAYPETPALFSGLNFALGKQQRIGIIGPNGRGKSTLLRVLAGELQPQAGRRRAHPSLQIALYSASRIVALHSDATVEEEIARMDPLMDYQAVRSVCGLMMFAQDDAKKKIRMLSGGERARVLLGQCLVQPVHCLLLDEPTNHLDQESCEALADAIQEFPGSSVLVTHDEMLLQEVCQEIYQLTPHGLELFRGSLAETFAAAASSGQRTPAQTDLVKSARNPKQERKERAANLAAKQQWLRPFREKLANLEKEIELLETELKQAENAYVVACEKSDKDGIARWPVVVSVLKNRLTGTLHAWQEVAERLEKQKQPE